LLRDFSWGHNFQTIAKQGKKCFTFLMLEETGVLALLELPRVGPKSVMRLIEAGISVNDCSSFVSCVTKELPSIIKFVPPSVSEIENIWQAAEQIVFHAKEQGILCLSICNPLYPKRLLNIPDPAPILFIMGNRASLDAPCAAVIGTRTPSSYGARCAERIAKRLAEGGVTVISGLAEGCDTEGHRGALHGRGKTAAILAHGFGQIYPASNRGLADEILAHDGCWVSEYAPGVPASRSSFVQRDRLQSGLSDAVIVIETDEKGGTMHTVEFAVKQKRELFAVNHPLERQEHPKTRGNQMLLKQGKAMPLSTADDIEKLIRSFASQGSFKTAVFISHSSEEFPFVKT
jgi:DNA processing protein